ncbi:hypothetical protein BX616_003378 [Lobosporangium transversale]|uniref:Uncharacterized protein n=1 Tax=Lobosporangium transversale TaxID=64571 RepID=A0A1Y2GK29_9FUNG|nr:hypothetical protein BCR41DRAFT_104131 [Lobosporangium transversale]KAF9916600.1 hypothetical protein BX616_003378 [Lobosporangium transversale]ORZ12080.1 hypothetical protein BCR41DRAFT_104131 [Lobosporangium transversale]|eukprot:XP_021879945.1 hypothetical protein BCR41DRAFT_104131 [Lobosporangium transversale]
MPGSGDRKQAVAAGGSRRKTSQSNTPTPSIIASSELGVKSQTTEGYAPVNNFNSQDVVNHFDRTWKAAREYHNQPSASNTGNEIYKGAETMPMTWADKDAAKGLMSNGVSFLAELKRKQAIAP